VAVFTIPHLKILNSIDLPVCCSRPRSLSLAYAEITRHAHATIDERRNIDSEVFWSDAL
jgi:hypothetical protein